MSISFHHPAAGHGMVFKKSIDMKKFDILGEVVLCAILAAAFGFQCVRFFFAGKMGWIIFLLPTYIFSSWLVGDIKSLRK